jgi:A/G-specific adenine glycosylase
MTIRQFRKRIYDYYSRHRRDLPWRRTHDPYRILVSEIMLQQTQVGRVIPKYAEFIRRFPSVSSLAACPLLEVVASWQGLGYNRRALLVHRLAKRIISEHGGRIPRARESLEGLPGIGRATAGAICAFAFNQPVIFIETNIRSVFLYFFFENKTHVGDNQLFPVIEKALDRKNPRLWYSALMDYGVHLKEALVNPSRRSRHYTRQSRFEGSTRQVRGLIVKNLVKHNRLKEAALCRLTGIEPDRLRRALAALCAEGLITQEGGRVGIGA